MLKRTKAYYNLPQSYRRQPHKYWKYDKDSYYILKINHNDFEILGYYPREEFAYKDFEEYQSDEPLINEGGYIYCIEKATDVNLKKLLEFGYFTLQLNWETLIKKTGIPYHKFYKLLRDVKKKNKMNSNHTDRYVYFVDGEYRVSRTFNGKQKSFGMYPNKEYAILVRDYLERIDWDVDLWNECRVRFLFEE